MIGSATEVLVAIGAVLAGVSGPAALVAAMAGLKNAREANRAVNHQPKDAPRLIELVIDTHQRTTRLESKFDKHLDLPAEVAHRGRRSSDG